MIDHYEKNADGRDFVVGDIHGCFTRLGNELSAIGFDEKVDRLFSVGDLVDRGSESEESLNWLSKPWFHPVRGNHEQMAIDAADGLYDAGNYISNGGAWFLALTTAERRLFADAFLALPIAIEVETPSGLVGIIHADCPVSDWAELIDAINFDKSGAVVQMCIWSRNRINRNITTNIDSVSMVVVGHTPVTTKKYLGNVVYIDTGAVFGSDITIIHINQEALIEMQEAA